MAARLTAYKKILSAEKDPAINDLPAKKSPLKFNGKIIIALSIRARKISKKSLRKIFSQKKISSHEWQIE
jgi:hypothetical protein